MATGRTPDGEFIYIPLQLAELLYVTLGPLAEVLKEEDHRWCFLINMVLKAYRDGRDDMLHKVYGDSILADIDLCTFLVSEQVCKWASDLAGEQTDFELWGEELKNGE